MPTPAETEMNQLRECATAKGDDFKMRVFRRDSLTATNQETVASFEGARAEHFTAPETWLPRMLGGGYYTLGAVHASEPTVPVAMIAAINIAGQRKTPPDLAVISKDDWQGPRILKYPQIAEVAERSAYSALIPGTGAAPTGGADARGQFPGGGPGASFDAVQASLGLLDQQRRYDADRIEKLIEAQAKATERQIMAMMEVVKSQAHRPPPPPEKPLVEQIAPLLAAATPIIAAFMSSRADDAKVGADREARREERENRAREAAEKAQAILIEKLSSGNSENAKVLGTMADVVSNSLKGQIQMVATMREMTATDQPVDEGGLVGVIKALGPALGDWLAAKAQGDAAVAAAKVGAVTGAPAPQLPPKPTPPNGAVNGTQHPADASSDAADAEEAAGLAAAPVPELINELVAAIKDHRDAAQLANAYLDAISLNTGFRDAVNAEKGTINFFRAKLGDPWVFAPAPGPSGKPNAAYLQTLVATLTTAAQSRGIQM